MRTVKLKTKAGEMVEAELEGTRLISIDGLSPRSIRYREPSQTMEVITEGFRLYPIDAHDWARQVLGQNHISQAMW